MKNEADYYAYLAGNCTDHPTMAVFHDEFVGTIAWISARTAQRQDCQTQARKPA